MKPITPEKRDEIIEGISKYLDGLTYSQSKDLLNSVKERAKRIFTLSVPPQNQQTNS